MSWIEKPAQNLVGSFDLSTLDIDQAFFNVSSTATIPVWLYGLSTACVKCPYSRITELGEAASELPPVSTLFPMKYRVRTDNTLYVAEDEADAFKFCDIEPNFGEFGVYDLHVSGTASDPQCVLTVVGEPVNIYLPILLAFFFYVLIFVAIKLFGRYGPGKRRHKSTSNGTSSAPRQASPTSTTSILSASSQNQPIDAETFEGGHHHTVPSAPSVTPSPQKQMQRLRSLDTFRGMCIMMKIFGNDGRIHYHFFEHSIWDGLSSEDLGFPCFLWIMGVAIPISIKSQIKRGTPKMRIFKSVVIRSLKLIGLGIIHNSVAGTSVFGEKANLRLPGVLQRFGVCYFLCSSLVLFTMNFNFTKPGASKLKAAIQDIGILWIAWIPILVIVMIHCLITFFLKIDGCPTGYLGPGGLHDNMAVNGSCIGGASGYLDSKIFTPKHLYQWATPNSIYGSETYDPEGFLGTLTSVFQVWLGVQTGATMLVFPRGSSRLKRWGMWGFATGALGALLCQAKETGGWIPINKHLWSLSFVLVSSSYALILLSVLYIIIDIKHWWKGSPFFEAGMNTILLYAGHSTYTSALPFHWSDGYMQTHFVRLIESLCGASLWALFAIYLHRKKTYWKA